MISLYNIVVMSYVEGWIAATKPTMTPGTPIYLGENSLLITLQFLRTKLGEQLDSVKLTDKEWRARLHSLSQ